MFKKIIPILLAAVLLVIPIRAHADVAVGDTVATLGANLTAEQREQMLREMGATDDTMIIEVTNEEEHEFLGGIIPKAKIGTRAISSSMLTFSEEGTGIVVQTNNISWVTPEMYTNALITAGLSDASVYITAPFSVSGTAALTGIMKAFQVSTGETVDEDVVRIANEEMVTTAELGEDIGNDEANALTATIKEKIAAESPTTAAEVKTIVLNTAQELNITLTDSQVETLTDLFHRMLDLNIDWDRISNELEKAGDRISDFLQSEQGQNFLESLRDIFNRIIDAIRSFFS